MSHDLLFEIGVEELPASYIRPALDQMIRLADEFCREARLEKSAIRAEGTPRRLALFVEALQDKQADLEEEAQGPSAKAAFDAEGKPNQVAQGFAKGKGVEVGQLSIKSTPKGDYVFARVMHKGRPTHDLLKDWLPQVPRRIAFPKTMRWFDGRALRFGRPINWLCALYGDKPVKFTVEFLESGGQTWGHRFLAPGPKPVKNAAAYEIVLAKARVCLSSTRREERIQKGLLDACSKTSLKLIEDKELVSICANLVEWPAVLLGHFDPKYLEIPEEVLVCAMREHQRYFAARTREGSLAPVFLVVTNGVEKNLPGVLEGNAQVLRARLEDARFFVAEDKKTPLAAKLEELKSVVWLEGLGTMHDKSLRLKELAAWLAGHLAPACAEAASRAALLCKGDLVSHVVGEKEFTSLQGVMGGIYALSSGENREVASGIAQHYRPRFAGDGIPATPESQMVALADKLDNLAGCFAAGLIPTGSQDPYALRRQAGGVLAILLAQAKDLSLEETLSQALNNFGERIAPALRPRLLGQLKEFFKLRLETTLGDHGFAPDVIQATLSRRHDRPREALVRAKALRSLRSSDDFEAVATAFSRVTNILAKSGGDTKVEERLFEEPAERTLHEKFLSIRPAVEKLVSLGQIQEAFAELAKLRGAIDQYFDSVMVMAEKPELRRNRLGLLTGIANTINLIADFTKLVKK